MEGLRSRGPAAEEQEVHTGHVDGSPSMLFDKGDLGKQGGYRRWLLTKDDAEAGRAPTSYRSVLDPATMQRACRLSADRGVASTEIGYGPELLEVISKAADEGEAGAKEVWRQYTESGDAVVSMVPWCVRWLLRLGADVEPAVRAFHDMFLKKYEAWHVDAETGEVDYARPGNCCGASSAGNAYLHDVLSACLSPEHVRLIKRRSKPGCHYGLIYLLGGAVAGFNPVAGRFNWDEVHRIKCEFTQYRKEVFLPAVDRVLRAAGAGEEELIVHVVSMVQENGRERDTLMLRVGKLSPAVARSHPDTARCITSTYEKLEGTAEWAAVKAFYVTAFCKGGDLSKLFEFRDDASVRIPKLSVAAWQHVARKVRARCQYSVPLFLMKCFL